VGGGVRYAVTDNVELDARYRNVRAFNTTVRDRSSDIISVGVNWRF
jgi:opacity protein-like surface antigen